MGKALLLGCTKVQGEAIFYFYWHWTSGSRVKKKKSHGTASPPPQTKVELYCCGRFQTQIKLEIALALKPEASMCKVFNTNGKNRWRNWANFCFSKPRSFWNLYMPGYFFIQIVLNYEKLHLKIILFVTLKMRWVGHKLPALNSQQQGEERWVGLLCTIVPPPFKTWIF